MKTTRLFALLLLSVSLVSIGGCSSFSDDNLSKAEANRLMALPKMPSYEISSDLKTAFGSGITSQFTLGTVQKIHASRKSCFAGNDCFEWIPIDLKVLDSYPHLGAHSIIVRVFPSSPKSPDLRDIFVGQKLLTSTSGGRKDDNDIFGYSTGWLFCVSDDGRIQNLDRANVFTASLNDVDDLVGSSFSSAY